MFRPVAMMAAGKGGGQTLQPVAPMAPPERLAAANVADESGLKLAVAAYLVSPGLLYAQQEERARLFRLLIGASALASIVGFLFAWRAFRKQLRLAEMKSNFVSSVSHELRAPIASVRLMAEGLERGKISEPAKQREYYRFITQECRRLSSMIENVLDFARIEQGRKQLRMERSAERGAGNAEQERDAALMCSAFLDGTAIQQALVNLIDNAIKHSPSGEEVVVSLDLPNPQSALRNLQLSVSDSGPGIPATEHEKIFERFYRLGSELRRETPGVGIGLSIVKHVVEAHGGRVQLESEVGQGSRFTMELPINVPPASRREEPVENPVSPGKSRGARISDVRTRQDAGGTL
jgi:signal transduction histidine kinase